MSLPSTLKRIVLGVRASWMLAGATLLILLSLETCYRGQAALRSLASGPEQVIAEGHPLQNVPWFREYLDEEEAARTLDWKPFVYYRRAPFNGEHINIDGHGRRKTAPSPTDLSKATDLFLFGGSTAWGDFQRDGGTIASEISTQLNRDNTNPVRVTNFGETGYVFTQEVVALMLELRGGARPSVVVFYDGINEIASLVQSRRPGVPQNEFQRVRDFDLGRTVFSWEPGLHADLRVFGASLLLSASRLQLITRLRAVALGEPDVLAGRADDLAGDYIEAYLATVDWVESVANDYDFTPLFIWQPTLWNGNKPLSDFEQELVDEVEGDPFYQEMRTLHTEIPHSLRGAMAERVGDRFLDLSGIFDDEAGTVFLDAVGHHGEAAASVVGRAIGTRIKALQRSNTGGR